jgi:hypothetical protein
VGLTNWVKIGLPRLHFLFDLLSEGGHYLKYFHRSFEISITAILGEKELEIAGHHDMIASGLEKKALLNNVQISCLCCYKQNHCQGQSAEPAELCRR